MLTLTVPICPLSIFHRSCPCWSVDVILLRVYFLFLQAHTIFLLPFSFVCSYYHTFFFSFNVFTCSYPFLWVFLCSINKIRTSVTLDMSVCKDDRLLKKGVCTNCRGCQCWNQPTYFSLKRNHNGYKTQWIYIIATNIFKNNYASDSS